MTDGQGRLAIKKERFIGTKQDVELIEEIPLKLIKKCYRCSEERTK